TPLATDLSWRNKGNGDVHRRDIACPFSYFWEIPSVSGDALLVHGFFWHRSCDPCLY
ncbi:hypothetical protein NL676_007099, partial [Syzygium grande]